MTRQIWVWLHRWAGLAMAGFLVVVGLTGSVLAFREELDVWLNPELLTVSSREAPLLDPLVLRDRAAALYPEARIDSVQLHVEPGRSVGFAFLPQADNESSPVIELFLDPYSGEKLGARTIGEVSLAKENIISFLYRLHYSLALPASTGSLGGYILGVTALIWTVDCFVSFYLTFPLRRRERRSGSTSPKSWWGRWKPAWLIKFGAGVYRINLDIHRAFGLWTWAMLFIFAWSSVGFNLSEVYRPTMNVLFGLSPQQMEMPASSHRPDPSRPDWRAAHDVGSMLLDQLARQHAFTIEWEAFLSYDHARGAYVMYAHSSLDREKQIGTNVVFDADTGALRKSSWPGDASEPTGDIITSWLFMLHMAHVFGLPMKIFVCGMGFVITALSVTGVYIWLKKRRARKLRVNRDAQGEAEAGVPAE